MRTVRIPVVLAATFIALLAVGTIHVAAQGQVASGPVDLRHGLDQWGRRPAPACSCTSWCSRPQRWCPCRSRRPGHCPCGWRTRCMGGWQRRCFCGRPNTLPRPPARAPHHPLPDRRPDLRPGPGPGPNPPRQGPGPGWPGPSRRRWQQPDPPVSGPPARRRRDFIAPGPPLEQPRSPGGAAPGRLPRRR